jgi:hypothetical protein
METIMRSRHPAPDSYRSEILDVEVNEHPADASDASDASETHRRLPSQSFRARHALKLMGVVMVAMFATVIVAQVGC